MPSNVPWLKHRVCATSYASHRSRSSPSTCGGSRTKLFAALSAGLLFGFGVCDLLMRLTAAPPPTPALTAATATTNSGPAIVRPTPTATIHPRRQPAPTFGHPPPPSATRGVAAQPSSLPRSHQSWAPSLCPANCSSHGVCNLDVGQCACELGYVGDDCSQPDEFPCDIPEGDELVSRCAGHCDDTELKCYCGGGKFPRRAMFQCEFRGVGRYMRWKGEGWNHARVAASPRDFWSAAADAPSFLAHHPDWAQPEGERVGRGPTVPWCDASPGGAGRPAATCNCHEGSDGSLCEIAVLMACLNQCNGQGVCHMGQCRCDQGWYGVDCSLHRGKVEALAAAEVGTAAEAEAVAEATWARRPLIYVYELPPRYNTEMWATKTEKKDCTIRAYSTHNSTRFHMHAFGMEVRRYHAL